MIAPRTSILDKLKMPLFLKILSGFYFLGFLLQVLDMLGFRLDFATMTTTWKMWTLYVLIFNLLTAVLLVYKEKWGIVLFHVVAASQLFAYFVFQEIFGRQDTVVIFHVLSLVLYWKIVARSKRFLMENKS